jgi:xanthine dehydrogenase large subunit
MGQGVNTNIKMLVADEFSIEPDWVITMPTSTEKNNNTSATAASAATDLNGNAAVNACIIIKRTLAECAADHFAKAEGLSSDTEQIVFAQGIIYDKRKPQSLLRWKDLVGMAYRERRSLGERGYYATPGIHFDWNEGKGSPFLYYTCGCAVAEVLIDRFTGDLKVERVDIYMDIGKQINPGINAGQLIGGFVQGMGWVTTEQLRYNERGALLSYSPTTYKIPNIQDIPDQFHLKILDNDCTVNVRGSKAVGEPPLPLGLSVWCAVKHALSFVSGDELPRLALPATNEEILMRMTYYEKLEQNADCNGNNKNGAKRPKKPAPGKSRAGAKP